MIFLYERGLVDYVEYLNSTKKTDVVNAEVIYFESEDTEREIALEVAMQWTTALHRERPHLREHDQHPRGRHPRRGLPRRADHAGQQVRARARASSRRRTTTSPATTSARASPRSSRSSSAEPQFEGQTKTKLGNTEAKAFVQKVVGDQLGDWFDRNPSAGARTSSARRMQAATARMAARKARETARRKGLLEGGGDARQAQGLPVEGPVAVARSSSSRATRPAARRCRAATRETQAILPLRGKILNVEKARLDRALGNNEVQAMITAFGTGIGEDFDAEKARYHKIVLMADADVDGQHITTLLLTLLFRYMRAAHRARLRLPRAAAAVPAQVDRTPTHEYVYSRPRARRAARGRARRGQAASRRTTASSATRVSARWTTKELWETTMNPETRTLLQVTLDDAAAADEIFATLMGEDVESRRTFIQQNAKDVRFLDI